MKNLLIRAAACSGLFILTMTANAQYQPREDQYRYQTQGEREARNIDHLFDRLRVDLDRVHAGTLPFTGDRSRVVMAREKVNDCQRMVNSGDYDRSTFNQTVSAIQRVVDLNRLSDQNRNDLVADISELRNLQLRLES